MNWLSTTLIPSLAAFIPGQPSVTRRLDGLVVMSLPFDNVAYAAWHSMDGNRVDRNQAGCF